VDLLGQLETALGANRAGEVEAIARRIAAGEGEIKPADRVTLLFELADWLWVAGARAAAIEITTKALELAQGGAALDPVTLARRLDRLAYRLEAVGHDSMAAEVWKQALDLTDISETEHGDAHAVRLERYLEVLERIGAPATQIESVREDWAHAFEMSKLGAGDQEALRRVEAELAMPRPSPLTAGELERLERLKRRYQRRLEVKPPPAPPPPVAAPAPAAPAAKRSAPMPEGMPVPEMAAPPSAPASSPMRDAFRRADTSEPSMGRPEVREPSDKAYYEVPVHFATHRARVASNDGDPYETFGSQPSAGDEMHFGVAHVTVPIKREVGSIPQPGRIAAYWYGRDVALHMTIQAVEVLGRGECLKRIGERVGRSKRREALVFVHGYNNSFTDAAFRCAQLAVDLRIDGAAVLYSWPSASTIIGLVADRDRVRNVIYQDEFRKFLIEVVRQSGATDIHVIAHSMGNQLALSSLATLADNQTEVGSLVRERVERLKALVKDGNAAEVRRIEEQTKSVFSELVFASPDVDLSQFRYAIGKAATLGRRTTVYTSKRDRPLQLASVLTFGPRAGLDASLLADVKGVSSVDTTRAPDDLLAHGSFASTVIDDMQGVIWLSLAPEMRKRLVRKEGPQGVYWEYDPDAPTGPFARALALIREYGYAAALNRPEANRDVPVKVAILHLQNGNA